MSKMPKNTDKNNYTLFISNVMVVGRRVRNPEIDTNPLEKLQKRVRHYIQAGMHEKNSTHVGNRSVFRRVFRF